MAGLGAPLALLSVESDSRQSIYTHRGTRPSTTRIADDRKCTLIQVLEELIDDGFKGDEATNSYVVINY